MSSGVIFGPDSNLRRSLRPVAKSLTLVPPISMTSTFMTVVNWVRSVGCLWAAPEPRATVCQSAGQAVRRRNQHWPHDQRRPWIGRAKNEPLKEGIQKYSQKEQVH